MSIEYDYTPEAQDALGMAGAMLSGAKQAPKGQEVYWNACVFTKEGVQIWHGDFNLTEGRAKLQALAEQVGTIYLTKEQPFRFDGLKAGMRARPDGFVRFDRGDGR